MVLVPSFDAETLPLSLTAAADGLHYELEDLRARGLLGLVDGLEESEVLG